MYNQGYSTSMKHGHTWPYSSYNDPTGTSRASCEKELVFVVVFKNLDPMSINSQAQN